MWLKNRKLFFFILFLILNFPSAFGQQKLSKAAIDSIISKGKIEYRNSEWGDVIDTFGDLLDIDPDNITANYYFAIGQREDGISKNPVEQIIRWNSAENHFNKVISLDSTFKDTFYQLAVLKSYRHDYFESAQLARHQMEINKSQQQASTGIFHLYDVMLDNENSDDAESFLKKSNSVYDKYFLGELYRREDKLEEAETIFKMLIEGKADLPLVPVYLSLVRIYVQQNRIEKADKTYWEAVDAVTNHVDAALLIKDFEFIVNEREFKILHSLIPLNQLKKVMSVLWLEKNPLPSLPYNMRIIEHYKRLIYAEKNYKYDGFRLNIYDANKLDIIRHPLWYYLNNEFNDRGLIYIRYGKPDNTSTTLQGVGQQNMVWLYNKTNSHPRMVFYFMIDKVAPPGYWKLVPMILNPNVLNDLLTWDSRYYNVVPWQRSTWNQLMTEGVETAERGLTTDSYTWPEEIKPLDAKITLNQFRETGDKNLLYFDYAVPLDELQTLSDNNDSLYLTVEISIFDSKLNLLIKKDSTYKVKRSGKFIYNNLFINGNKISLKKQKCIISMDIRVPQENKLFGYYSDYTLNDFNDTLSCSSLEEAYNITPNDNSRERGKDNITILPNPTLTFDKSENVYTYYEIYNLSYGNDKRTNYTVSFDIQRKDNSKSIWDFFTGLFGKSDLYNISIKNNYNGNTKNVSDYLSFDISELKSGDYKMTLKVKDNVNNKETSTSSDLIIK